MRYCAETLGHSIHDKNTFQNTAVHRAAAGGQVSALIWLEAQGADIRATNSSGDTPYHVACNSGKHDAIRYYLESGAFGVDDPNGLGPDAMVAGWRVLWCR